MNIVMNTAKTLLDKYNYLQYLKIMQFGSRKKKKKKEDSWSHWNSLHACGSNSILLTCKNRLLSPEAGNRGNFNQKRWRFLISTAVQRLKKKKKKKGKLAISTQGKKIYSRTCWREGRFDNSRWAMMLSKDKYLEKKGLSRDHKSTLFH